MVHRLSEDQLNWTIMAITEIADALVLTLAQIETL